MPPPREERGQMVRYPGDARSARLASTPRGRSHDSAIQKQREKKSTLWSRMKSLMLERFSS